MKDCISTCFPKTYFPSLAILFPVRKPIIVIFLLPSIKKKNSYTLESGEGEIGLMFSDLERDIRLCRL